MNDIDFKQIQNVFYPQILVQIEKQKNISEYYFFFRWITNLALNINRSNLFSCLEIEIDKISVFFSLQMSKTCSIFTITNMEVSVRS